LGLLAARRGLRTIVAELASQERVQGLFIDDGREQFRELELVPGLFTISIDPQQAMEEYLRVKAGAIGQALGSSRLFQAFAMATPGMRELLSIGKVWELAQLNRRTRGGAPYDLVIVDAPATGHGVGLLRTPRTFAEIARVGPIAAQARQVAALLEDAGRSALIAVAQPAELPVSETLELERRVLAALGRPLDALVVNGLLAGRLSAADVDRLAAGDGAVPGAVVIAARRRHGQAAAQQGQLRRLRRHAEAPITTLPFLSRPELHVDDVRELAERL
jgi:anion-transporting  ArsA/GET3 family ATPase